MSLTYDDLDFTNVGTSAGCTTIPSTHIPSGVSIGINKIDQGWRSSPLLFSKRLASLITRDLQDMINLPNPETYIFSQEVTLSCGNEIKRFGMALQGYSKSYKPLIPLKVLLDGVSDENFADVLKKTRVATLTRRYKAESNIDDGLDPYVLPNFNELEDIGQVFNYKYWIRWAEPDPEAWKFGLLPLVEPSEDFKMRFRDALRVVLPESVAEVQPGEILSSISGSSCRTSTGRATKVFREKMNVESNYMSSSFLSGFRSTVYKGPTETRDCLILPICQSNTIKWIEKQVARICKDTKYSAYGKGKEEFERTLSSFYNPDSHYYNRDLTKEGITKPRWILTEIGKVCKELYPNCRVWDYFSIYDRYELTVDGVKHSLPRGTGLGMANALTTIMQCALFQMLIDQEIELPDADALFYNDDATIKSLSSVDILTYAGIEAELFEEAGLILKESKTYSSPVMILCERYFPTNLNRKDSYSRYVHRLPFAATNIIMAKSQFSLCDDPVFGSLEAYLLPLALSFWGCEWDNEEYRLPTFMGGWLAPVYKGVRLDFLDSIPETQLAARGLRVGPPKLKPDNFFLEKGTFFHPILNASNIPLDRLDQDIWELYDFVKPMSQMAAKFHRSLDDGVFHKFLQKELIRRYLIWSQPAKPVTVADIYLKVIKDYPLVDFIPPENFRKEVPLEKISSTHPRSYPPDQPNKLLAVVSFFSGCSYIDKVIPYPYLPGERNHAWDLTDDRLSKYRESIYALPGVSQICDMTRNYELDAVLTERHYCADYDVWSAWKAATGRDTYPRPLRRSKGGQIKHDHQRYLWQAEYLGSQEHWDMWTTIGRTIPVIHMSGILSIQDWNDILQLDEDDLLEKVESLENQYIDPEQKITSDFGTYYAGHREGYEPPGYLKDVFTEVKRLVDQAVLWKSVHAQSDDRDQGPNEVMGRDMPREGSPRDLVYKRFTNVTGYYYVGIYVYQITLPDVFGGDGSDSDDGMMGLFDDPGG
jgi:hypothetical protein